MVGGLEEGRRCGVMETGIVKVEGFHWQKISHSVGARWMSRNDANVALVGLVQTPANRTLILIIALPLPLLRTGVEHGSSDDPISDVPRSNAHVASYGRLFCTSPG